jgi:hypothetical protein
MRKPISDDERERADQRELQVAVRELRVEDRAHCTDLRHGLVCVDVPNRSAHARPEREWVTARLHDELLRPHQIEVS